MLIIPPPHRLGTKQNGVQDEEVFAPLRKHVDPPSIQTPIAPIMLWMLLVYLMGLLMGNHREDRLYGKRQTQLWGRGGGISSTRAPLPGSFSLHPFTPTADGQRLSSTALQDVSKTGRAPPFLNTQIPAWDIDVQLLQHVRSTLANCSDSSKAFILPRRICRLQCNIDRRQDALNIAKSLDSGRKWRPRGTARATAVLGSRLNGTPISNPEGTPRELTALYGEPFLPQRRTPGQRPANMGARTFSTRAPRTASLVRWGRSPPGSPQLQKGQLLSRRQHRRRNDCKP